MTELPNGGATINPHAEFQGDTCMVRNEDGTDGTKRAHSFHWLWNDGQPTNIIRCNNCGLEQENGK